MPSTPKNKASGLSFAELQRWFLDQVVGPHRTNSAAARGSVPERSVSDVILPSATLGAERRIQIYTDMYFWRLRGIMANEHPVLEALLGEDDFDTLARDFLSRFPPHDYTLRPLAHAMPHYLRHHCQRDDSGLLLDVARLERAVSDAFDTPFMGRLTTEDLGKVPPEAWPEVRFRMDPSFRVLALDYDAWALIDAFHEERELPSRDPRKSWAVVWRQGHRVWRLPLSQPVYTILAALASGQSVTTALERGMEVWTDDESALESKIFQWFADWVNEGYFRSIVLPEATEAE